MVAFQRACKMIVHISIYLVFTKLHRTFTNTPSHTHIST